MDATTISLSLALLLVAAGLLLNGYLAWRRRAETAGDPADLALEALATESMEELLIELQRAVHDIQGQLGRQRSALAELLSDSALRAPPPAAMDDPPPHRAPPPEPPAPERDERPRLRPEGRAPALPQDRDPFADFDARAASADSDAPPVAIRPAQVARSGGELRAAVEQLLEEGLSDRAIARRLRIGLEEVRLTRMRSGRAS